MPRARKIYHVGGWKRNYGDLAIQYSMVDTLSEDSRHKLLFIPIEIKDGFKITKEIVNVMNVEGDMLLVGGGGMIMKGDGFETVSGWQFNITDEALELLDIPLVIYGIGHNVFEGDRLSKETIDHLKRTQEKSELFSVRDHGTNNFLVGCGLTPSEVIPDPAMFCPSMDVDLSCFIDTTDPLLVGVNLAGDRLDQRFRYPSDKVALYKRFRNLMLHNKKIHLILLPHMFYDMSILHGLQEYVEDLGRCTNIADVFPEMFPETLPMVPKLVGIYEQMSFVFGVRGHSNILSFGAGACTVGLGNHIKNSYFAEQTSGLSQNYHMSDAVDIIEQFSFDGPQYLQKTSADHRTRRGLRGDLDSFNKKLLEFLD